MFLRKAIALVLSVCILPSSAPVAGAEAAGSTLREYLHKPYLELFEIAPSLNFTPADFEQERQAMKSAENSCRNKFKESSKLYSKRLSTLRNGLKSGSAALQDETRHTMHCSIQNLELLQSETDVLREQAIPRAYDNMEAKLELLEHWPEQQRLMRADLASGAYQSRRWSDVKDIGFREIASGQRDDIKRGKDAVEELKMMGMLPPEIDSKPVRDYVKSVADRVAQHSDLKIPLHVTVLQSKEANAFALPGGYLFIERGLLEQVDDEAQLAGVIAHEIAHDTARHSAKLMKRATIAGIFYQAAQIAAIVLTGGVAGIGLAYALQYGFYGLGFVLDLKLLGISRDYEIEADQLGIQYAWNAGYDTSGFIRFFDKMATRVGYVNGVSWFRTHPPFYDRMVLSMREIAFLPASGNALVQTSEFMQMKKDLVSVTLEADREERDKPSLLLTKEEGCEPPKKLEYEPGQPIEEICSVTSGALEIATQQ